MKIENNLRSFASQNVKLKIRELVSQGFGIEKEKTKIIFVFLFVILGFIALQIPVNGLAGSKVKFTLFDLFAPISGAFLGTVWGMAAVLSMQIFNILIHGFDSVDRGTFLRLIPTIFGVWFFARKEGRLLIIPALAMLSFNLNPVGRSVWFYSMFWLIPYLVWPFREKSLLARSLGSTFMIHAVGGAVWIWAFNLPAEVWRGLIPITMMERSIFALGISASYILMNNVIAYLSTKIVLPKGIYWDKKLAFSFKKH